MTKDKATILEFPVQKVRLQRKEFVHEEVTSQNQKYVFGTLLTIVFAMLVFNQHMMMVQPEVATVSNGRGIASIGDTQTMISQNHALAKQLSEKAVSPLSTRGAKPDDLDQLTFGRLGGKYSVRLNSENKVSAIELNQNNSASVFRDRRQFIGSLNSLLPVEFSQVEAISVAPESEVYALIDRRGTKVGTVTIELDGQSHLVSLQFNKRNLMVNN